MVVSVADVVTHAQTRWSGVDVASAFGACDEEATQRILWGARRAGVEPCVICI